MLMLESLKSGVSTSSATHTPPRCYSIDEERVCGDAPDTFDLGGDSNQVTSMQGRSGGARSGDRSAISGVDGWDGWLRR